MDEVEEKTRPATPAPGQLHAIRVDIDNPKMNFDMPMNMMNIIVGTNGSGKSFILKLSWMLGFIGSSYNRFIKDFPSQLDIKDRIVKEFAQYGLDGTFSHPDFTGSVRGDYGSCSIELKMDAGKVTDVTMTGFEDILDFTQTVYMSGAMRTFNAISGYLRARKKIESDGSPEGNGRRIQSLLEEFRLYDITYVEQMINKCPLKFPANALEILEKDFDFDKDIETLDVDLDACEFFLLFKDGKKKFMTTYGAGHQSIMNMTVGNLNGGTA